MKFSICFIHGLGDDECRFRQFAADLRDCGMDCSTLRLPDFHSSSPRPNVARPLANEVERCFSSQNGELCKVIVAHSLGGLLALSHDRIRNAADKFVLVEPSIRDADLSFFKMLLKLPQGDRIGRFCSMLLEQNSEVPSDYIKKITQWSEEGFATYCKLAVEMIPNATHNLARVRGKTHIACGRTSWGSSTDIDKRISDNAKMHYFSDSGHWPFVTQSEMFIKFLNHTLVT